MTAKKNPLWAGMINLNGLYSGKPVKLNYNEEIKEWRDRDGNLTVKRKGMEVQSGYVIFASEDKKEVYCWIKGTEAVMALLRKWSRMPGQDSTS